MHVMSHEEWREFVSAGRRTGTLATVRADGRPHAVPVWFVLDGDDVLFNTGENTVKGRNMRREPRAALCVQDEEAPFSFVMLEGHVQVVDDLDEVRRWATQIGARYMGADRAEEFGARNGVPGELVVRLTPDHVTAHARVAE